MAQQSPRRLELTVTADQAGDSLLASAGKLIAPLFIPLGFGFWQAAVALLTGLIAKEMVVSSLSMFYGFSLMAGGSEVARPWRLHPLSAFSCWCLSCLYVPAVAVGFHPV